MRPRIGKNSVQRAGARHGLTRHIYGISIIQADDQWDLEHAVYYLSPYSSLAGDLYPGYFGRTEFSSYTKPNSSNYYFWAGSDPKYGYSGVTVKNITENGENITANFFPLFPGSSKEVRPGDSLACSR